MEQDDDGGLKRRRVVKERRQSGGMRGGGKMSEMGVRRQEKEEVEKSKTVGGESMRKEVGKSRKRKLDTVG